jgi:hypothetical protein
MNMGSIFDQLEKDLLEEFKAITPEQRAADDARRKALREWEAAHTAFDNDIDPEDKEFE